jgi:hypothetical protein
MFRHLALVATLAVAASPAFAEPTRIMVRAQALDAKFIGDHTGGVKVTLRDARTGKVLTQGLIRGGTGDTTRIMKTPRLRYGQLSDDQTAGFAAVVDIAEPTLVRIEAEGPLGKRPSATTASSTLWLIPGRHIDGDGVVLTFPGLIVEPTVALDGAGQFRILAKVSPMCGCPIEAKGLWDAANYSVRATLLRNNRAVAETALSFTGKTGEYAGVLPKQEAGGYAVRVVAFDSKTPNTGVAMEPIEGTR